MATKNKYRTVNTYSQPLNDPEMGKAKPSASPKMEERGVREGRNENIADDGTRERSMASIANLEDVNKKNKWKGTM